jgi:hypothetical protein
VAIRTERFIAEQPGVEPGFVYQSAAYLPEIQATYNEYKMVDGFDLKKQQLGDWLARAERKKPMHPRRGSAR